LAAKSGLATDRAESDVGNDEAAAAVDGTTAGTGATGMLVAASTDDADVDEEAARASFAAGGIVMCSGNDDNDDGTDASMEGREDATPSMRLGGGREKMPFLLLLKLLLLLLLLLWSPLRPRACTALRSC
jgi:hypothetical protein